MKKEVTQAKKNEFSSQSSDRLLQILERLAEYKTPVRLQDISEDLGITQSTTLRYLNSLIKQNYAYQDEETLRYAITWKICRLGHIITSNNSIRDLVSPYLRILVYQLNIAASLSVHKDGSLIYLDVIDNPATIHNSLQRIGKNAPMHSTGSGKVLLAYLQQQQARDIIKIKGLQKLTSKTISDIDTLLKDLGTIREQGYAIDDEECEEGIRCISVPIYDYTDSVAAAMSVFGSVHDLEYDYIRSAIVPLLKETSTVISTRLGYSNSNYS